MRLQIYLATIFFTAIFMAAISSCQPRISDCPPESITYTDPAALQTSNPGGESQVGPVPVEIRGKETQVDRVVHGSFCNDHWEGRVYVACDLQIPAWEEDPTFLEACSLTIEPGTVVYVAAHNDEAFYKGCSCHTLEEPDF